MDRNLRIVDRAWDKEIAEALRQDNTILRIVCPFIKEETARRLLEFGTPNAIQVITRFNLADFYNGVSDTGALRLLLGHGGRIRGVRNLHAKVFVFGNSTAMVTSANLTESALLRNHEVGVVGKEPVFVQECVIYFDDVWTRSGNDLTEHRLQKWGQIIEKARSQPCPSRATPSLNDEGCDLRLPP